MTCTATKHDRVKWNGGDVMCAACGSYLCWVPWHPRHDDGYPHRCGKSDDHGTQHECECGATLNAEEGTPGRVPSPHRRR